MHDLLIHEFWPRRLHWRYDDPNGVSGPPPSARRIAGEARIRVPRPTTPKAA